MASSGNFTTTSSNNRSLKFSWEIKSQSVADNKTTISWKVVGAGSASGYVKCGGIYVKINGTVIVDESTDTRYEVYNGTTVKSGTTTIAHNSDGTKTFSAEVKAGIYQYARNVSGSGSWTLTAIPRKATLSTATNFNDEGNPSITYSNPAGTAATTLQAYIYASDDSTVLVGGKDLTKTGTSFTFSLTNAERNTLRKACVNANSMTVKFYVKTIISGTTYWSSAIDKTFSIINANPTVSASVIDNGSESTRLTGDSNVMIKGYNNVDASMTATALKGATIKSYKIVNGSTTVNAASGSFHYTENPTFVFTATDSRGNVASKTITMPMVEYIKLTCGLSAGMTVDGVVDATISGKCFKGSFGAYNNEIVVKYRYKISTGDYGDWTDAVATFNGENYNASVSISGLDYRSKYVIQAKIIDSISSQTSVEKTLSCIPVFDWSEEDFNFNVPVSINGNPVIKCGASTGSTLIGATPANTTDNGICLRPNGVGTAEGQVFINGNGRVRINGDLKIGDEVMADFIVASGSSGIYAYRKWSSGRLELWGRINLSPTSRTGGDARGNVYYCQYNASNDTTFPFTFVDNPYVQATVSSTSTYLTLAYVGCTNSKISTFICTRGNNDFYATAVDVYVMGRWK